MEWFRYRLECNGSLNRWRTGGVEKQPFASPCETFEAPVNYGEAYVQIVYPVRRAFLAGHDLSAIPLPPEPFPHIYFPFERNRVDFSTFLHTPHHLRVKGISWIDAPDAGDYPFEIYTCGGLKLWVNGEEALNFTPFTRNIPGKTETRLPLKQGMNELRIYAEELAERDVFFYFEFRYKGRSPLEGALLLDQGAEEIRRVEQFLRSCYFPRDCLSGGDMILHHEPDTLDRDRKLRVRFSPHAERPDFEVPARKGSEHTVIGPVGNRVGLFKFSISVDAAGIPISRELVLGIRPSLLTALDSGGDTRARKMRAMDFILEYGEELVNRAMVICERRGAWSSEAERYVRLSLKTINDMEDCADFHLVPLLLCITRYNALIPPELLEEIRPLILKFRYWIDEPGNDVMWYFSENHAFLFHVSQYLAGHIFPEETFSASGRTGKEQSVIGEKRVRGWFKMFFDWGFAEWNSATYIPIDLLGFFVLYEMAPDREIRDMAKEALDYTFKIMVYNSFNGIMSSSYGRAYEHTLKSREQVEPCFLEWAAYGSGWVNFRTRSVALFALSSYEPPPYNRDIVTGEEGWMSVAFDQGMNRVKTYSYRTADFFLASVRRFKPFQHGHQQHLLNLALGEKAVQFYVNHPGEPAYSGENRPSYWAGNGTIPFIEQYRDLALMIFNIDPEELVHYIHGSTGFYDYDEYETPSPWLFFRVDRAFCAVWFSGSYQIVRKGANTGKEVISEGLNHGVVIRCGSTCEWGTFKDFCSALKQAKVSYDGERELVFQDPRHGLFKVSTPGSTTLNGIELPFQDHPEMHIERGKLTKSTG